MTKWTTIFHIFLIATLVFQVQSFNWGEWGDGRNWGKRNDVLPKTYKKR